MWKIYFAGKIKEMEFPDANNYATTCFYAGYKVTFSIELKEIYINE